MAVKITNKYISTPDVIDLREFDLLSTAISSIGAAEKTILISEPFIVEEDVTVPESVSLKFTKGGKLVVQGGYTLTVNGCIEAGLYQIFDGDGTVTGNLKVECVYPEWFGAKGDGVNDDTIAIQRAIDCYNHVVLTREYLITSTIYAPVDINLYGVSNKRTKIFLGGTSANYTEGAILINTTDGNSWIEQYPNMKTGRVSNLQMFNNTGESIHGIVAAGSITIENITFEGFAKSIKIIGDYTDTVTIRRIHCPRPLNTPDYQIEANGLGDGYVMEQIHILPNSDGTPKNGILLGFCAGGRLSEIVGGNIYLNRCYPVVVENVHLEKTTITVDTSIVEIRDCFFYVASEPVIKLINQTGYRYRASLRNVTFVVGRSWSSSNVGQFDIQFDLGYQVILDGCFRKLSEPGSIAESHLMGIKATDGTAPVDEFNNYSHILSLSSIFDTFDRKILNTPPIYCGSTALYTGGYTQTTGGTTWEAASGTYYFQYAVIYDPVRMIGAVNANPEVSLSLTQGGNGVVHSVSVGQRGERTILRIYKGTATGSYDSYVDIPLVNLFQVFDNGITANGFPYEARTAGGMDSLNSTIVEITKINEDGTVICRGSAPPTVGTWQTGDIIYNISPTVDANSMIVLGWICVTGGSPGTWEPMYVSTTSPAV